MTNHRLLVLGAALLVLALAVAGVLVRSPGGAGFAVLPYLQSPGARAMTVRWLSPEDQPGALTYVELGPRPAAQGQGEGVSPGESPAAHTVDTQPAQARALAGGYGQKAPYLHRARLENLQPNTVYGYEVVQGGERFRGRFRTAPLPETRVPLRFIALADCETSPDSAGRYVRWGDPSGRDPDRRYLIDQATGLANNLAVVTARDPDFVTISGDLVDAGGMQSHWDALWRALARGDGQTSLAGHAPVIAVPGNHEYWSGKTHQYEQPSSEQALRRFTTYFESPPNGAQEPAQEGRYFRIDYGPIALIGLDVSNDSPHRSPRDTNFKLLGEGDPGGGHAPRFTPGSAQYRWLENQLRQARESHPLTVVILHYVPYSVGPHGWPPGLRDPVASALGGSDDAPQSRAVSDRHDPLSGVPVRVLTALFLRYGVDLLLAGHDEMLQRSEIMGQEERPDGSLRPHTLHVYDIGICGDSLRSPQPGLDNPHQRFLAHDDAPEIWREGRLVAGGKHYGHLEIDLTPVAQDRWHVSVEPVYVLPLVGPDGSFSSYERRVYDDVVGFEVAPSEP